MNRLLRCFIPVLCAGLIPILSATAQNTPARGPVSAPSQPGAQDASPRFKNLKVLPDNISTDDLRKFMRQYSGDLGVDCEFCHTARDPITRRSDRASDANPAKETARFMIQMTGDLNDKYLAEMPSRRYADPITCGTCHRGEKHPSIFVAPPRQDGNRPPGPPPAAMAPPAAPPAK